jgi:hypothetical protein
LLAIGLDLLSPALLDVLLAGGVTDLHHGPLHERDDPALADGRLDLTFLHDVMQQLDLHFRKSSVEVGRFDVVAAALAAF